MHFDATPHIMPPRPCALLRGQPTSAMVSRQLTVMSAKRAAGLRLAALRGWRVWGCQ